MKARQACCPGGLLVCAAKAREYMQVLRGAAARKERQGASSSAGVRAALSLPVFPPAVGLRRGGALSAAYSKLFCKVYTVL